MGFLEKISLARQAIYDNNLTVQGYELLYSCAVADSPDSNEADGSTATAASTLTAALTDIGLDAIAGDLPVWVRLEDGFLSADIAGVLPPERTVIEVLETTDPSGTIAALRMEGYRVAVHDNATPQGASLPAGQVDFVKIDTSAHSDQSLADRVSLLRACGAELLAINVNTYETVERCRELGITLVQGDFISTPRTLSGVRVSTDVRVRMQLVVQLNDPEASFELLARLISSDVTLSYRLLRYINSAYVGRIKHVASLREALVTLGARRVRSWATLLLLADSGAGRWDIVGTALVRARMCETLAEHTADHPDGAFMVGLLSVADALVDGPLADTLAELPLDAEIAKAILEHEGVLGELLVHVIAHEHGDFPDTGPATALDGQTTRAYIEAIKWSSELLAAIPE